MVNPEQTLNFPRLFFIQRINTRVFFILVFVLQLLVIFQGFDLSDEGFLSTFYTRIFSNPQSVSYCFMFWLTGIIGGIWVKIFSPLGLLGIRLGGVVINTLCVFATFQLLKKYLSDFALKIGLIVVILSLNNDIKVLNYNILSALLYILTTSLMFSGLKKSSLVRIFLGGFLVGLNVFIRTPNLLELGLVAAILYYNYLNLQRWTTVTKQIACFISGFIAAVIFVIFIMYLIGHLQIFMNSLRLLFAMGKGAKHPDVEGGYGISRMLDLFRNNLIQSVKFAVIPIGAVLCTLFLINKLEAASGIKRFLINLVWFAGIAIIILLIVRHRIDHFTTLFFIIGLILITSIPIFLGHAEKNIKLLLFFGCFFLLSFPVGSSDGVWTAGRYCLWIGLPIAIDYILQIQSTSFDVTLTRNKDQVFYSFPVTASQLGIVKKILLFLLVFSSLFYFYFYPFFDRRNRADMHYALESANLKGIYTTKGRSRVFNELLRESAKYVKPNDYVIAYDNIPMFYYATNTLPLLANPSPGVYNANLFQVDLNSIGERSNIMPPVIRQKIATIGDASKWPEIVQPGNYFENARNLDRNAILDSFLTKNNYVEVWRNKAFEILVPDSNHYTPQKGAATLKTSKNSNLSNVKY
ncbi:MAG TPA: hypothetical protein VGG71_07750 [Chitinophagaceae bacterium]|jgi:hypothetical protein